MRIKPEQAEQHFHQGLFPVYLVSGDEPLQLGEMADAVRAAARNAGFETREVLAVETGFDWKTLTVSAGSLSIFSDKKIIDLRLAGSSPGAEGSKALIAYCERPPEDTLLLITLGKLAGESLKSKWFQALEKVGVIIQVWPLEGQDLIRWLQQRLQRRGLYADHESVGLLAEKVEGNLLAAAQEIEKLYVLNGAGPLGRQQIFDTVADSSRYDVFKLVDSILSANVNRIFKIMSVLRAEGVAAAIVLWAVTREARTLIKIQQALTQGQDRETAYRNNQIWDKRRQLVSNALSRLNRRDLDGVLILGAKTDRQIKGQESGDPWESLMSLCLALASVRALAGSS